MNIIGLDDILLPASSVHPYRYVLIAIDYFSKWIELIPMISNDANDVIQALKIFMARNQKPKLIISDGAKVYTTSQKFTDFLKDNEIAHNFSAREHQQANGEAEREVREFIPVLRIKCENDPNTWPEKLVFVQASRNSAIRAATGHSPYYVLRGCEPRMLSEKSFENYDPIVKERLDEVLKKNLDEKSRQEDQYNKAATKIPNLKVGDNVVIKKTGHVPK